jgi:hypothetical protein
MEVFMTKISDLPVHNLIGGMTTDYFEFWCEDCVERINGLKYYGEDTVGVKLKAICKKCNREYIFKIRVTPPLTSLFK